MSKDKNKKSYRDRINALATEFDAADKTYKDLREAQEQIVTTEGRALTEEETTARTEARSARDEVAERIEELRSDRARAKSVAEARRDAGMDEATDDSKVVTEPRTYGPGSPNSYFADFIQMGSAQWKGHDEARKRMAQYATEISHDLRNDPNSPAALRTASAVRDTFRKNGSRSADDAVSELRTRADAEVRAMDTGSTSGGSFVTPQYFVSDYAVYRQFGRIFIDAANKQALPDYGMEVYIPSVSNAAGVASQSSQNTGIDEQDPTALYLSSALNTLAGQVTVSQQLLDRAGPNFSFDKMVFDQLNRAYAVAVDQYVLTQAIATAGTITATATTFTTPGEVSTSSPFYASYAFQKIGQAKAATVDAAGTVLPATHAFFVPSRWEFLSTSTAANGQPFVQPNYAGVFQAIAAGSAGTAMCEGDTGYTLSGLNVFEDGNIPLQSSIDQTVVAHMPEVWVWEGDLVPRTIPQTYAQDLSVLLQLYAYVTCIVRYPLAVQTIQWSYNTNTQWPA